MSNPSRFNAVVVRLTCSLELSGSTLRLKLFMIFLILPGEWNANIHNHLHIS
jgi:hypothetical protein